MSIARIRLDESSKLEFGVSITGADGKPNARFVIDGKDFSVSFPAKPTNEGVEVDIQGLSTIFTAGEYNARLEVVLENKIYTPLEDKIEFEPSVHIETKSRVVTPVKESVRVEKVTVKTPVINEDVQRKVQAANIIAKALYYEPLAGQTPKSIVNSALVNTEYFTNKQIETVIEMLDLAESVGIDYDKDLIPELKPVVVIEEVKEPEDDEWSDAELDKMAATVDEWEDIADEYDAGELHIVDDETGEVVDDLKDELKEDTLNEVLSRVERIKAKVRFHKSAAKRERKLKLALTKHSTAATINARARNLAVKTMKMRLAKKPLAQLSIAEKERIEKIISRKKKIVDRLAMKMVPRIRTIEKQRLSHTTTK